MNYRPLGRTGLKVSVIGFGAWGIGGNAGGAVAYGPTDDGESARAVERAVQRGVTLFDTADLYGYGHSEELLGEVLAPRRPDVVIATKVGMIEGGSRQDFSRRHIMESVTASLRRLRTDYLDIYQLHNPPREVLECRECPLDVMEELRGQKVVRAVGISLRAPEDGRDIVDRFPVGCIQVNFNMSDQRSAESGLFARCAEKGVGIIVRTPLAGGFLTGRYSDPTAFGEFDQRRRWSKAQVRRWNQAGKFFAAVMARHPEDTPSQFALRYCLSFPQTSTAIPGMLTAAHVDENTAAGERQGLDESELADISRVYRSVEFFVKE
ncbi:MAG: aldo/keto reductase [bacterium]